MLAVILNGYHERRQIRCIVRDRTHPMDKYGELDFYRKFRFDRPTILELTDLLKDDLEFSDRRNNPYPPVVQVLAALRYYASNSFQDVVAETLIASQPSVSRIVKRVSIALAKKAPNFIRYPQDATMVNKYRQDFAEMAGFPQVVGCIDCTHIRIIPPRETAQMYYNRKGWPSLNVQAVCGPKCEFTDIVVKWPGKTHDSTIFNQSSLGNKLENGQCQGILVGDSGYPCRPFLMRPYDFASALNDPMKKRFNDAHARTRVTMEQAFGRWKRRFSILHGEIRLKLETIFPVIVACGVLHNLATQKGLPDLDDDDYMEAEVGNVMGDVMLDEFQDGNSLRDHIAETFFP